MAAENSKDRGVMRYLFVFTTSLILCLVHSLLLGVSAENKTNMFRYKSAAVLEVNEATTEYITSFSRDRDNNIVEESTYRVRDGIIVDALYPKQYDKEDILAGPDILLFKKIKETGVPVIFPGRRVGMDDKWWGKAIIRHEEGDVPINVYYRYEAEDLILGEKVAIINFLINGIFFTVNNIRKQIAGVGSCVWSLDADHSILKNIEIKYGETIIDNPEIRLFYSESFIGI